MGKSIFLIAAGLGIVAAANVASWQNLYSTPGGGCLKPSRAEGAKKKFDFFFAEGVFFFLVHFLKEMAFFGKLL